MNHRSPLDIALLHQVMKLVLEIYSSESVVNAHTPKGDLKFCFLTAVLRFSQRLIGFVFTMKIITIVWLIFERQLRKPNESEMCFCFAPTRNNRKAVENLFDFVALRLEEGFFGDRPSRIEVVRSVRRALASNFAAIFSEQCFGHSWLVNLQLCRGVAALFALSGCETSTANSKLPVMVANDHSPLPVALSVWARSCKRPTVYVQHGTITFAFPAQEFDLYVVNDERSAAIYKSKLQLNASRFCTVPRFKSDFFRGHAQKQEQLRRVVISLGVQPEVPSVRELVKRLRSWQPECDVVIRPHPRTKSRFIKAISHQSGISVWHDGVHRYRDFDMNLSGSSGVHLDFLHFGVPSVYVAQLDLEQIEFDYYGFVSEKIVPTLTLEEDSVLPPAEFWSSDWEERFAQYDPTVTTSLKDLSTLAKTELARVGVL